jgi:hypothetical protein
MADKSFKVKTGLDLPAPLPVEQGGTGQTSTANTINALLPIQTDNNGKYLSTNGTAISWQSIDLSNYKVEISTPLSSNITMLSGRRYLVDTTAARTLTLPSNPVAGDEIQILDTTNNALVNNLLKNLKHFHI